jgi:hypothetical protein
LIVISLLYYITTFYTCLHRFRAASAEQSRQAGSSGHLFYPSIYRHCKAAQQPGQHSKDFSSTFLIFLMVLSPAPDLSTPFYYIKCSII